MSPLNIFTLPLFPLHTVLFPHVLLQLHIFEERYKAMINRCIDRNEPFGVVLIREGQEVGVPAVPYETGCMARILAVKRLEDGRMHLVAAGESRFLLLDYVEAELPYLLGRVELIEEVPSQPEELAADAQEVADLFERYLSLLAEQANIQLPDPEIPDDPMLLSYYVAYVAQIELPLKQKLLELTTVRQRLRMEIELLRQVIEEMQALQTRNLVREQSEENDFVARVIDVREEPWRVLRQQGRN